MSTRTAELAVDVVSDVVKAVAGLDDVGDASRGASSGVEKMGREAQESARKLNITADSADELGGKAGKATGALGALSSGFELVGAEKYAGALQGASLATDFFSGVGDSLNLVMESTIIKTARARVTAIAHGIATKASAVATGVMTAGQWALNAALSANPIVLVVIALVALVAAFVIAYKHSATFRAIVTGAFRAVTGAASATFNWVKRNWPLLLAIITGPIGLAVLLVVRNWDRIKGATQAAWRAVTGAVRDALGNVMDLVRSIPGRITNVFSKAAGWLSSAGRDLIRGFIGGIRDMAGSLVGAIKSFVIDKIPGPIRRALGISSPSRLFKGYGRNLVEGLVIGIRDSVPDLARTMAKVTGTVAAAQPDLNGSLTLNAGGGSRGTGTSSAAGAGGAVFNIRVDGALDPTAVAQQIVQILVRLARSLGIPVAQLLGGTR